MAITEEGRRRITEGDLVGRTIVAVDFGRYKTEEGAAWMDPVITFDDGRQMSFVTLESEAGVIIKLTAPRHADPSRAA